MTSMSSFSIEGYCEEEKKGGKEFHMPDPPNLKPRDWSSVGNRCLVLIQSGVVFVIAHPAVTP